jgi:molecular chaperone GrpE
MTKHDDIQEKNKTTEQSEAQKNQATDKTNEETEKLKQKLEEAENKYIRALADYQNLQNRVKKEKEEWIKLSNREMLLRLLPVLDTLVLASQHLDDKGLKVSINMFLDTLKAEGVTKIKTEGEKFNPETMECIQTDAGEENKVLAEIRAGYMMHDRLLRPAQVKVGKKE